MLGFSFSEMTPPFSWKASSDIESVSSRDTLAFVCERTAT